jgi:pyruvate formate-lyase/glycerol dehydratase family glycyl radical enzyme
MNDYNSPDYWKKLDVRTSPTERIKKLKECFIDCDPVMCCDRAMIYTESYRKNKSLPMVLKRARALKATLEQIPIFIWNEELIVGHPASKPRGAEVFPEVNLSFMDEIDEFETRECNRLTVEPEVKQKLLEILPYWEGKTIHDQLVQIRPKEVHGAIQMGLLSNPHEWSGFAHVSIDYKKLLTMGIEGILKEISDLRSKTSITDPDYAERSVFYSACEEICEGILHYAARYKELAIIMAGKETDGARRTELLHIAEILNRIPQKPARTFDEAIQAVWFMQLLPQIESNGFSISFGRFDQYMAGYLTDDLQSGRTTIEKAQELLDNFWLKCCEILRVDTKSAAEVNAGYASGQNLEIGGMDITGGDVTNILTVMCLAANYHIRLHQPNFTVRLHKNTPETMIIKTIESISCGNGMPQVLNDHVIVRSLIKHGIPPEEAYEYLPVGCDEITVRGQWGRCNGGYINFAKLIELTLTGGHDLVSNARIGLQQDAGALDTFERFLSAFYRQLDFGISLQVCEANITDYVHKNLLPLPFISLFLDDCLKKGRDVTDGGGHHNTTGLVGVGTATCSDSLNAIRTIVYEDKRLSLDGLKNILQKNYEGSEVIRQFNVNKIHKFGNDEDRVDALAYGLTEHYFDELEKYRNYRTGAFWPALYSVSAQIGLGNLTAATPDGRYAGLPLSDGLTPMYGLDKKGPTASLKSVTKVNLDRAPNGVIVNQRMLPNLFKSESGKTKMAMLLRSFVDADGFHWQFNIIDNETLLDAQKNPGNYRGLVVRVAGYSAIFVDLSKKTQDSIIARYSADV